MQICRLGAWAACALSLSLTSEAIAENEVFQTLSGPLRVFQTLDEERGIYCRERPFGGPDCGVVEVADLGNGFAFSFGNFGFLYDTEANRLELSHLQNQATSEFDLVVLSGDFSGARYSGFWGGSAPSWYQILSVDTPNSVGRIAYQFRDFPTDTWQMEVIGNVLYIRFGDGTEFYFIQADESTYGLRYAAGESSPATVLMTEEPFQFESPAQCAQAYLNFAGFDVGPADGQPGPRSRAGSEQYLAQNQSAQLEPLDRSNGEAWCEHLMRETGARPAVAALGGS